jgi:EthD domain
LYKLIYLERRNPNLTREEWPATWRSHSTFAGQFSRMRGGMKYSRYCNRIDAPTLNGVRVDLQDVSAAHDGVAVACSDKLELLQGGGFTTKERARIQHDELRVFDRLTPECSFHCTERPVKDGEVGEAVVFRFLARDPDIPRISFTERLTGEHAAVAQRAVDGLRSVTRYTHNSPLHRPLPHFPFDAISECWFESVECAVRALKNGELGAIERDLREFCDLERGVTMLCDVCNRWPP